MHLHCHLAECTKDYGPIFGFWLFSFERYNGMLGRFPNNQKHIEVQLMQRFETEMQLHALPLPETLQEPFFALLNTATGDAYDLLKLQADFELYYLANSDFQQANVMLIFKCLWNIPSCWTIHLFTNLELVPMSRSLRHVFTVPGFIPGIDSLPVTSRCYKRIEFGEEVFSVFNSSRYGRHCFILASWAGSGGDIDTKCGLRPGRIQKIYIYKFVAGDGEVYTLPLCRVEWYKEHSKKNMFGRGLHLYCKEDFEPFGPSSFMPIACITSKFAPAYGSINVAVTGTTFECVLFVCPLRSRSFF